MKKLELSKMTNKELMESALNEIRNLGYHITNVEMGNCYFLFEGEEDSICHFYIKEIPRF